MSRNASEPQAALGQPESTRSGAGAAGRRL